MKAASFVLMFTVLGCASKAPSPQPSADVDQMPPQSKMKELEFRFIDYLRRHEVRGTITQDGMLRWLQTDNKSWGPGDADSKYEKKSIRKGQLVPEQISDLMDLFRRWESLPETFPARADEPEITIRYGDKTVSGGALSPPLSEIYDHIQKLAITMPISAN